MAAYRFITQEEAIINTDWAAGARKVAVSAPELIIRDGKLSVERLPCIPALFKIYDEILVNCLDHWVRQGRKKRGEVRKISITEANGVFKIRNDGDGVPIILYNIPELGGPIWFPTIVFSAFNQTTNANKAADDIIGGVNGLGAKIVATMSKVFTIRTRSEGKYFEQTFRDNKTITSPPIISDDIGEGFTEVEFLPDYNGVFGGIDYTTHLPIFHGRAALAALYTTAEVSFNGVVLPNDPKVILRELSPSPSEVFVCDMLGTPYNWTAYIQAGAQYKISIVNGIVVKRGPHIEHLENYLTEEIGKRISRSMKSSEKIKKSAICGHLGYILIARIPNPSWEGQRKDVICGNITSYSSRVIKPAVLAKLSAALEKYVVETLLAKKRRKREKIDKYYPSSRKGAGTVLYCVEGDSAMSQVKTAITNHPHLTFKRCGLFSLGGVIVNVRREISFRQGVSSRLVDMSDKLRKNQRISAFLEATGLRYDYTYETIEQRKTLKYEHLRIVPDQDFDGKGKILPLVVSFIEVCWPSLLRRPSYVQWQQSPIIRAYPERGGNVGSFYSVAAFDEWRLSHQSGYNIKYYKGMASHSAEETLAMFKNPPIFELFTDEKSHELFEIYLGDTPAKRRRVLSEKTQLEELQSRDGGISCSDHLLCEADHFQRDDLLRKLDNYIDGLTQSGRKILDGCLEQFGKKAAAKKIDSIAGSILEKKSYEHGASSLAQSIIGKAAIYRRQLPVLLPHGMFGSRLNGGDDAGAPRYISASLNSRLCSVLYPDEDYELLSFTFNEGHRGEPSYFIPIIPMAICETTELPSHGWKLQKWAKDSLDVIKCTRLMISGRAMLPEMRYYRGDWTGEFRQIGLKTYSVGRYKIDGSKVIISELPLGVWSNPWAAKLIENEDNDPIYSHCNDEGNTETKVYTVITLRDGGAEKLAEYATSFFTGPEVYFGLFHSMNDELNMFTESLSVREFSSYHEILRAWFPHRKDLYCKRIERRELKRRCRAELVEQQIRYAARRSTLNLMKETAMISLLESEGFPRLSPSMLHGKQYCSNEEFLAKFHDGEYGYLLNMTDAQRSSEAQERREALLAELRAPREVSEPFCGAEEWLAELSELEKVITEGRKTSWQFSEHKKYTF